MFPILIKAAFVFSILMIHFLLTTKVQRIKNSNIIRRTLCVITAAIAFFLILTPFENKLLQASTPEKVFEYTTVGTLIAKKEGADSCALLYQSKTGNFSTMILTKNGDRYQKHDGKTETHTFTAETESHSFYIYLRRAADSSDFYLLIGGEASEDVTVTDTLGTTFTPVYQRQLGERTQLYYLEAIDFHPDTYEIFINGTNVLHPND